MEQALFLAHPLDKTYNKSVALAQQLASVFPRLIVHEIPAMDRSLSRRRHLAARVVAYQSIWRECAGLPCDVVWLSEFRYTFANLIFARVLGWRLRALVIGGPHVMRIDGMYFSNMAVAAAEYSRRPLCLPRGLSFRLQERLKLGLIDVLQSHSQAYSKRILTYCRTRKTSVIVPISSPETERLRPADSIPQEDLTLVFWGTPSVLHGLDLLPEAVRRLCDLGVEVDVLVYAAINDNLRAVLLDAERLGVRQHFRIEDRILSRNWHVLTGREIAISHLVSAALSSDARNACESTTTNKMFEVLSLGLPLLVADTPAVREAVRPDECFLVSPGSVESIVCALKYACENPAVVRARAEAGHAAYLSRLAPERTASSIRDQLVHLNRA